MMRLVLITRRFWPLVGGAEVAMANLASEFQRNGCQVHLLTARWDKQWPTEFVHREIPVVRLPNPSARGWGTFRYMRAIHSWLRRHQDEIDLVLVSQLKHDAFAALGAVAGTDIPVVLRAEGGGVTGDCHWHEVGRFGMKIRKRTHQASAVVTPSHPIAEELRNAGYSPDRVHVVDNGVEIPPERTIKRQGDARLALAEAHPVFSVSPRAPLVVYTGRLHEGKGLDELIEAWPEVNRHWPDAKLWVVGEGPHGRHLWNRVNELELADRVVFPGAFDDLVEILHAADVFVMPSHEEAMSLSLLEAMSVGLPVVASDIRGGNTKAMIDRETGLVVPINDPAAIARSIDALLRDPETASRYGQAARQRVIDHFTLAVMGKRHLNLFESLQQQRSRNSH